MLCCMALHVWQQADGMFIYRRAALQHLQHMGSRLRCGALQTDPQPCSRAGVFVHHSQNLALLLWTSAEWAALQVIKASCLPGTQ